MKETVNHFIADKFGTREAIPVGFNALAQPKAFAQDLGNFVYQLHQLEAMGTEQPSLMLPIIEAEFLTLLDQMKRIAPIEGLRLYWDKASKNPWTKPAVVLHGSLNLDTVWTTSDKFSGVAETASSLVGDPACDLTIAWEIFDEKQRKIFFSAAETDKATVIRARVWALYKAMKNYNATDIDQSILARDVLFRINEELGLGAEPDLY
ncbi:hypothetical protein [uncultured Lactococcus sp.]|uniref:hypothetical protein n=1 Tax=uncultured Lactococcus sp. TaxID=167973 RepID=UPI0027DBBB49|nr:hypothetical protein [uncultured Lactococcus sp.]